MSTKIKGRGMENLKLLNEVLVEIIFVADTVSLKLR